MTPIYRGPPKGYIEAIETRLHRMESLLGGLVHSSDPRAQAILTELMQGDMSKSEKFDFISYRNGSDGTSNVGHVGSDDSLNIINSPNTKTTADGKDSLLINDLNKVMEIISIDENRQIRYHGRSSGLYLLRKSDRYKDGILSISSYPGEMIASTQNYNLVKRSDLMDLPTEDLSNHLLEIYFTHLHPILPVIHKPRFFDQLKDKEHLPQLLLNAIYSYAARFSDNPNLRKNPDDSDSAGDIFFDRAKALLDNEYDKARVTTVQALVVLSIREYGAARVTRGWMYAGMAARMAQDLGMHRNSEKWSLHQQTHDEIEERKRVFWACFVLDSGSPIPANASTQQVSHSISRFICLIKLGEITGAIIQNVYAIRNNLQTTGETVLTILNSALNKWFSTLPPHLQYDPSSDQPSDITTLCLHIIYYSTLMLLHRPYTASNNSSHNVCTSAANAITRITDMMLERKMLSRCINPVVYCVFTAAVIHVYNATQADHSISHPAKINLHKSRKVLEYLKKVWPSAHRYSNMLEGLANLKDVQPSVSTDDELLSDANRSSRRRGNFSNNNKYSSGEIDRHERQERFRAQFNQSIPSHKNSGHDDKDSSSHVVNSSLMNTSQPYAPISTLINFAGSIPTMPSQPTSTSQHQRFSAPFNQSPPQQLHHGLDESAQMFNNSFGFRNISSLSSNADPQNQPVGDTDPYAAPGMVGGNGSTLDPLSTGLWNFPSNANLDEWTTYFSSQQMQPNLAFSSPPIPSQPPIIQVPRVSSMPLQQHDMLLHNDGNDVNMFADNHPLISNVMSGNGKGNNGNRGETGSNPGFDGGTSLSSRSGGKNGVKDKSTVPLTY
ncbi:11594_t:CDS:2, partial [Acaulospora colombiana]